MKDLVTVSGPISETSRRPSKEIWMHQAIYRTRPDIHAIFHLHSVPCIAATLLLGQGNPLRLFTDAHVKKLGRVLHGAYAPAGSQMLADIAAQLFQECDAILLYRHGILVGGPSAEEAFLKSEYLVEACQLYITLLSQKDPALMQLAIS